MISPGFTLVNILLFRLMQGAFGQKPMQLLSLISVLVVIALLRAFLRISVAWLRQQDGPVQTFSFRRISLIVWIVWQISIFVCLMPGVGWCF